MQRRNHADSFRQRLSVSNSLKDVCQFCVQGGRLTRQQLCTGTWRQAPTEPRNHATSGCPEARVKNINRPRECGRTNCANREVPPCKMRQTAGKSHVLQFQQRCHATHATNDPSGLEENWSTSRCSRLARNAKCEKWLWASLLAQEPGIKCQSTPLSALRFFGALHRTAHLHLVRFRSPGQEAMLALIAPQPSWS